MILTNEEFLKVLERLDPELFEDEDLDDEQEFLNDLEEWIDDEDDDLDDPLDEE